ncbi:hypothetical protein CEXT_489911 [Caerostris extrusa]|uniref:Uncharacterized protein n=1 Tax=Caerostris extrusa TaxID=172846 RepID=A0AAV4WCL3_CAEEX|nr:hypothetical protein CEXT_489911 [Caerostris extrusa]
MGWNLSGRSSNNSKNVTLFSPIFHCKNATEVLEKIPQTFFCFLRYALDSRFVGKKSKSVKKMISLSDGLREKKKERKRRMERDKSGDLERVVPKVRKQFRRCVVFRRGKRKSKISTPTLSEDVSPLVLVENNLKWGGIFYMIEKLKDTKTSLSLFLSTKSTCTCL